MNDDEALVDNEVTKLNYWEKSMPQYPLSTTNPTKPGLGLNLGLHSGRFVSDCLSHGMAKAWLFLEYSEDGDSYVFICWIQLH
jgi:hypothetical protein